MKELPACPTGFVKCKWPGAVIELGDSTTKKLKVWGHRSPFGVAYVRAESSKRMDDSMVRDLDTFQAQQFLMRSVFIPPSGMSRIIYFHLMVYSLQFCCSSLRPNGRRSICGHTEALINKLLTSVVWAPISSILAVPTIPYHLVISPSICYFTLHIHWNYFYLFSLDFLICLLLFVSIFLLLCIYISKAFFP